MSRILVGSPIRQKPEILKAFLKGLENAEKGENELSYFFVDDNKVQESTEILNSFMCSNNNVILKKGDDLFTSKIDKEYDLHGWRAENIQQITCFKDAIIEYCIEQRFDYLLFVDSDIVLYKKSLLQLISDNVEIVSNVFWTQWNVNRGLFPQCFWTPDIYVQKDGFGEPITPEQANKIRRETDSQLKVPGVYEVKGLGACTLIKRSALEKGVRFKEIPTLSVFGEDRHFCVRAGTLGIKLYMDTNYPVYHIFREEYLSRVDEFMRDGFKFDMCQTFAPEEKEQPKKKTFLQKLKQAAKIMLE